VHSIKRDVPEGGKCTVFASARSIAAAGKEAAIHLSMVVNDGINDRLYLSLANSASDTLWSTAPAWLACPFNAGSAPSPLRIAGVQISEASDAEFIVVDIERNPTDPAPEIARYYIDVSQLSSPRWIEHNVPIDIESASYASCLGRTSDGFGVDGLYLAGSVGGVGQLVYSPLYNASILPRPLFHVACSCRAN